MPSDGGAVFHRAGNRNLELTRQVGKLWVQRAPLAQHFRIRARVHHFVHGNTSALVAGDIANAIAAGLDAMQVHAGQQFHDVGAFGQGNPVELHVLAGGEVAAVGDKTRGDAAADLVLRTLGMGKGGSFGAIKLAGHAG